MSATSLSNRAMLVSLNISQWSARKLDKNETVAVRNKHGATSKAARVNKSLLPGAYKLEQVQKIAGEIRTWFYRNTLPWGRDGMAIIKSENYLAFMANMRAFRSRFDQAVNDFVADYPSMVVSAQYDLGTLYNSADYPAAHEVASKFKLDVSFLPVPDAADWRVDVGDEAMAELRKQISDEVTRSQAIAMKDAWRRLYEVVEHASAKLTDPKAIFRDSLVNNAVELCAVLPSLNIANDPDLERMRRDVEQALCKHNPGTLRKDPRVRSDAAKKLSDIQKKLGSFYA